MNGNQETPAGSSSHRPRGRTLLPLLAGLTLAGCAGKPPPAAPRPQAVRVAEVTEGDGSRVLRLGGTLEARRSVAPSFSVPGTVEQVFVEVGDRVKKGQPLASLGKASFADALAIASAKARQAEDAERRLAPMRANETLPEVKMVEVETGLEAARASVSLARKNLADAVLRAPVDGVIARRIAEPGLAALPGTPMFTLVQTEELFATAQVPEKQVARVRVGDSARVRIPALDRTVDGTITELGVIADPLTRSYAVKVALPNPGDLRVGMVAELRLGVAGDAHVPAVPQAAVRIDEAGRPFVFVVTKENTLVRRPVTVDGFAGEAVGLSAGVAAGERVVVSGTAMLAEGMTVRVVEEATPVAADGSRP